MLSEFFSAYRCAREGGAESRCAKAFAARPSGTEEVYKLYAESFRGSEHLQRIQQEAQAILARAFNP